MPNKKVKAVVMATDNNYIRFLYIAVCSLIKYNKNIKLYILSIEKIHIDHVLLIESLKKKDVSLSIVWIEIDDRFNGLPLPGHVSKTTYARVLIPTVVREKRCLMLDIDILVRDDLTELFELEMDNYYLAGRKSLGFSIYKVDESTKKIYGIPNFDSYINVGIMCMNLDLIRANGIDKLLRDEIESKDIPEADQGIFNKICYGKIKFIPVRYNWDGILKDYQAVYGHTDVDNGIKRPAIIHYINDKPWVNVYRAYAGEWWKTAEKAPFFRELCEFAIHNMLTPSFPTTGAVSFVNKFLRYIEEQNVIIYGAGHNGGRLFEMLRQRGICPLCFAVSVQPEVKEQFGVAIKCIDEIHDLRDYSIVLITVHDQNAIDSISEKLSEIGFRYIVVPQNYYEPNL